MRIMSVLMLEGSKDSNLPGVKGQSNEKVMRWWKENFVEILT